MSEHDDFKAWLKTWALPGNTSREDAMHAAWQARADRTAPDALQAEVERLREERDSYQRVGIKALEERDALKNLLRKAESALHKAGNTAPLMGEIEAALAAKPEEACPLCNGDCSAANPPVTNCPLDASAKPEVDHE